MDPQQRVALEVAWEALENAGLAPDKLSETRAAVMLGVYYNEYQSLAAQNINTIDAYSATGNAHSVTVGRIATCSACAVLRWPWTACSSSLVSVHLACQSLRTGERPGPAGGVNLTLRRKPNWRWVNGGCCRRAESAAPSTPRRRVRPRRGVPASWSCSSASPTPSATATACWRWCAVRR